MASWKKVIVSGSNANLTALSVDNLTSGSVVIGGGTGNLSTTTINGTGSIVATTGASGLSHSGSFSGSFQGTISGGNAFIQDGNSFGTTAVLGTNDTQNLAFETNGSVRMTISSSGNVGIGISTPSASLHINNTTTSASFIVEDDTNPDSTPFVIDASGSVGIGTLTPISKLQVQTSTTEGDIRIGGGNGSGSARLALVSHATTAYIDMYGNDGYLPLRIDAAPLTINTTSGSGHVGIGTTAPNAKLHITNTSTSASFLVDDSANPDSTPFVIDASGSVAIGSTGSYKPYNGDLTTIPKLDVFASGSIPLTIRTTDQNSDHVLFTSMDTNTKWWIALSGNDFRIYNTASAENILFGVDGSSVDTGNRVGIGTALPNARLHINNTSTSASFLVEDSTNPDSTAFVIDSKGSVGIGVSPGSQYLAYSASLYIETSGSAHGSSVSLRLRESASNAQFNLSPFSGSAGKSLALNDDTSGLATQVWTEAGYVGIGTLTPTTKLHVSGTISSEVSSLNDNFLSLLAKNNREHYIKPKAGAGQRIQFTSDGPTPYDVQFDSSNASVYIMTGSLGIGTTTPNARLDVSGSAIISGSLTVTGGITGSITASGVFGPYGANSVTSASHAVNSAATTGTLTFGSGLSTGTFNGSTATTISVTGSSALTSNKVVKWTGTAFADTSLTDNGTAVTGASSIQLTGASSSLTGSFTGSFTGNGAGLTGLATTLLVSASLYDGHPTPTSGSVSLTSQGLTIQGTGNEIEAVIVGQTVTIGLPNDVAILNHLTVGGDLYVNGTTTTVNTADLYIEDKFILLASGSATAGDAGIIIDQGSDAAANIAFGFDSATNRWGYQSGLTDSSNALDPTSANGASGSFAVYSFTQAAHSATKPTTGEFVVAGSIYTANDESIWMYS